jgi:hypothetical protein
MHQLNGAQRRQVRARVEQAARRFTCHLALGSGLVSFLRQMEDAGEGEPLVLNRMSESQILDALCAQEQVRGVVLCASTTFTGFGRADLSQLEGLFLFWQENFGGDALLDVALQSPKLRVLVLYGCPISNDVLVECFKLWPCLEHVELSAFNTFPACTRAATGDDVLEALAACTNLSTLRLSNSPVYTNNGIRRMVHAGGGKRLQKIVGSQLPNHPSNTLTVTQLRMILPRGPRAKLECMQDTIHTLEFHMTPQQQAQLQPGCSGKRAKTC